ncbi:hypothetical protein [Nonomuraea sp. NPDC049646]|uniref:hypothetical protein n=1 Tax=unclassified Nonomuraea TaxID=2593643 RepID=UPI00379D6A5E
MLNTAQWPQLELPVLTGVRLDPKNVRLETTDAQVEADILEDLFANEDALGLVDGISKVGYLTHETPIVVKRRSQYVVVEGNRRVAALKAIQNPMLVPKYQARVVALSANIQDISMLANIRVMVAPNQSLADQLIAAIHTGNIRRPWSPARQAAFFQAQIDAGRKLADLQRRYPTIDVRYFVFRSHIVNLFKNMDYDDPGLKDFVATKEWRRGLSTLSRIYESKGFLDLTGLVMDDKGVVGKAISDEGLKAVATIIVEGIKDGDLNTRSLNTVGSPRFTRLIKELQEAAENAPQTSVVTPGGNPGRAGGAGSGATGSPGSNPRPTTGSGAGPTQPTSPPAAGQQQPNPQGPKPKQPVSKKGKTRYLALGHLVVPSQYPVAVRLHIEELSALNIQKFPNTAFLAFRALLEKSIKAYADAKGVSIQASGNNSHGYVQLHHALKWLSEYVAQNGPRGLNQPISQLRTGKVINYTATNDALNAVNHNHHFNVDPDEAINCWNSIEPIMRELMRP